MEVFESLPYDRNQVDERPKKMCTDQNPKRNENRKQWDSGVKRRFR
jgi:hypothetical protein